MHRATVWRWPGRRTTPARPSRAWIPSCSRSSPLASSTAWRARFARRTSRAAVHRPGRAGPLATTPGAARTSPEPPSIRSGRRSPAGETTRRRRFGGAVAWSLGDDYAGAAAGRSILTPKRGSSPGASLFGGTATRSSLFGSLWAWVTALAREVLAGRDVRSLTADPNRPQRLYAGPG